jgi:hypothetical protein
MLARHRRVRRTRPCVRRALLAVEVVDITPQPLRRLISEQGTDRVSCLAWCHLAGCLVFPQTHAGDREFPDLPKLQT